ncbi:hypothetical protein [Deinococcus koreensis]|uniref:Uncharacterized protein n=1 Tax=Deinococcus koreensis TaxID=2054903 RepID=A0A2K3UVS1_9DEIO|nr:hypothetical protein [Deinococcus koreensis]PNY80633.1 hypothetical protein CVO96_03985 [Deinococcus koreensis]
MIAFLLFIVLPLLLLVVAWRIRPLVPRDEHQTDPLGGSLAAGGMFGSHGLEADRVSVREETEQVRFRLDDLKERE